MIRLIILCGVLAYAFTLPSGLFAQPTCDGNITFKDQLDAFSDPSFEEITECPEEISRMDLSQHWNPASIASSDQYDLCGDAINHWELPELILPLPDGTAFVGGLSLFTQQEYVEGVGTTLLTPLVPGQLYELRGYVQLGTESDEFDPLETFTLSVYGSPLTNVLPYEGFGCPPNSLGFEEIGSATSSGFGWVEFSMILEPNDFISTIVLTPSCGPNGQGYFYLDHLSLFEVEEVSPALTIGLSGNCQSEFVLTALPDLTGYDYAWYRNGIALGVGRTYNLPLDNEGVYQAVLSHPDGIGCVTSQLLVERPSYTTIIDTVICEGGRIDIGTQSFDLTGSYEVLLATQGGCDSIVELHLDIIPYATLVIENNQVLCFSDTVSIHVAATGMNGPYNIDWTDGSQSWQRELPGGTYMVTVTDQHGCETLEEYTIDEPERVVPLVEITDVSCPNGSDGALMVTGTGGVGGYLYQVDDRAAQNGARAEYNGLVAQSFGLQMIDENGCLFDSAFVIEAPAPLQLNIRIPEEGICLQDQFSAYVVVDEPRYINDWNWRLSSLTKAEESTFSGHEIQIFPNSFGPHTLAVTGVDDNGCIYSADTIIFIDHCIEWPNAFSPNGDGINDLFDGPVDDYLQVERIELEIYSRWGNLVYRSSSNPAWDGTLRGVVVPEGVYVYKSSIQFVDGSRKRYLGDILLTR